ncbi:carbohydrate ABC transporter permease [Peribacillus sp. SCS-155]|uniref:carbohydrate ABC transporter permease n=1 Tax=Peribacillus sedimenti TaxID=3115297 RepID=UPI0039061C16
MMKKAIQKFTGPYSVMAPGLLLLAIFAIYPTIFLVTISFQNYNPINIENPFVGFENYSRLFQDHNFWNAIKVTAIFVVSTVTIEFVLGMALALLLNQQLKGKRVFRTLILLPIVMTPTVVGLMFRFMMNEQYGILNYIAELIGIKRTAWLSDPDTALPALILTDIWQWTPFMAIILLAGLQGMSDDTIEAAQIDGASKWQTFIFVTIPGLSKIIYIAMLLRTIDSFRIYDTVYMMTNGGPVNYTSTLSWIVYDKGFKFLDFGYGAAICIILLIIVVTLLSFVLRKIDLFESGVNNGK